MSEQQPEKVFVSGMYLNRVHPNAPEFIITNQSIHAQRMITWLQENAGLADENGYIKVVGKESKSVNEKGENTRYFEVDSWKPTNEQAPVVATAQPPVNTAPVNAGEDTRVAPPVDIYPEENVDESEIPF
jgi:hypothetical protein